MKTKLLELLVLIAFATLSFSCVTQRRCNAKFPPQTSVIVKDSIITKDTIIYRDKIVPYYIKGDTVFAEKKVPVTVDISPVWAQNDYATASAWIEGSRLKLQLIQKDQVIKIIIDSAFKEVSHWKEKFSSKEVTKIPEPVKYIPNIVKFFAWIGGLSLLLIILFVSYKIFKPKIL
jgi:hypothetical protein